ncbi:hypothetical protein D3C86_1361410 [compost metagenome]
MAVVKSAGAGTKRVVPDRSAMMATPAAEAAIAPPTTIRRLRPWRAVVGRVVCSSRRSDAACRAALCSRAA